MKKFFSSARFWRPFGVLLGAALLLTLADRFQCPELLHTALHEVGFALLVAFIIWILFELHMALEADAVWAARIEKIGQNVLFAVLQKNLPKDLMDEARTLALETSLLRSGFNVTYTLLDGIFKIDGTKDAPCVLIAATMSFRMQNISSSSVNWKAGIALPNPIHPDLKNKVKVDYVSILKGGVEITEANATNAKENFTRELSSSEKTYITYNAGDVSIAPGETIDFRASYLMAKEEEDTEFLQTLYPSDGLTVTVVDKSANNGRVFFAEAVHRRGIETLSSPDNLGTRIFTISGYLLPHQGVLIWWKRTPVGTQATLNGVL